MVRVYGLILLAIWMITAGCGYSNAEHRNDQDAVDPEKNADGDNEADTPDAVPVEVAIVGTGTISSFLLLSSTVQTEQVVDIYPRVLGIVEEILVEEGTKVKKGAILVRLDDDEYVYAEEKARITYDQQMSEYARFEKIFEKELISKEEFDKAKYGMKQSELDWKQAKLNLDRTRVRAPISGIISVRIVRLGNRVQPSDKLFAMVNLDEMIVEVHVPEKEIDFCRVGQRAEITSDIMKNQKFKGKVKRISPVINPESGTFKVVIGLQSTPRLRPGMFVNAHIITDTHKDAVLLQKNALVYEEDRIYAFTVDGDTMAYKRQLKIGFQDAENVEVTEGIEKNAKVVVVGQSGLQDKTRINIIQNQEAIVKTDS